MVRWLKWPRSADASSIGHYKITRQLGVGGMGVVYAALDERLGRTVAIKMISENSQYPRARARLWREARSAAGINHPNICQVYEIGERDGDPYIVMELLEGESLTERLKRGVLPVGEATRIALEMLEALDALQARGLLHRDLKPSNTFLTPHGVKILDFGLARTAVSEDLTRQSDGESSLTATGTIVGTPRYVSPEHLQGKYLDARCDLFAVGTILYEMVAGRPAFAGSTPLQIFHAILHEQPQPLEGSPELASLNPIVIRALAKRPEERYPSARAMADDLRRLPTLAAALAVAPPSAQRPEVGRQTADTPVRSLDDTAADVVAGQQALSRGAWEEGRGHFESALSREPTPAALEGLGIALMCLGEPDAATLEAWEKAYRLYLEQGNRRAAASVATKLALEYEAGRGERAVASGWLQRAHRLLEDLEPGPEHARLAVWEAHLDLLFHNDTDRARERIAEAIDLGRSLGLADVEMQSLALEGIALVREGQVVEGMRTLDEVTTAAVAGEFKDLSAAGNASCYFMTACEQVQDYDRVGQWFERVRTFFDQWRHRRALTFCRNHLVAVLLWRGNWKEAEAEIEAMRRESATIAPAFVGVGTARLAELRRRQGRSDEAAALFAEVEAHPEALLGRAAMALDVSDLETALDLIDRFFRRLAPRDKLGRAPGLELLVRAQAALGNREQAAAALAELRALTEGAATDAMRATLCAASAIAADAAGDRETARRCFEDAVDLFDRTGAPFELGRARIGLAGCLKALGRQAAAEKEARAALACLEKIGATHEASRAAALLVEAVAR